MALKVTTYDGVDVGFVQIAGLVARRIVCEVKLDEPVRAGQLFGLIRFGSRLDVYLPEGVAPLVVPYQTTIAGERSEEHTSELQSLMRISYAVFGLKKKK